MGDTVPRTWPYLSLRSLESSWLEKNFTKSTQRTSEKLKSIYLLCGLEECPPQWTDHRGPKVYAEKALGGGAPDGRKQMCTKSDCPSESFHLFGVTHCDSYSPS